MAEKDTLKELKRLSPNERLERLKELQKKDREEIEKAQKLLQETEEEIGREKELEKIPIPQLKSVDIGTLFSSEEKELFKAKRFVTEGPKKEKPVKPKPEEKKSELEEIAAEAKVLKQDEEAAHAQYLAQLSEQPAKELYNKVKEIYNQVKETGYMSQDQANELNNISYANKRKFEAAQTGKYPEVTQKTAREMVLTEKMRSWIQDSYGRG